jgi:HK97 family phage portal protein
MRWPWQPRTEERALWQVGDIPMQPTIAGVSVTPETALRHSAVFGCVRLLADTISGMPVDVFRAGSDQPIEPLPALMQRPSADMEMHEFLWAAMASLLLRGNCWGQVVDRNASTFLPSQIELLDPDLVQARYEDGKKIVRVNGRPVDPASMWHIRAYPYPGQRQWADLNGLSPIRYAAEAIGLGLAAEAYGASWFDSGGVPSGVWRNKEKRFDKNDVEELKKTYTGGHRRRARTAVIGAQWDFEKISVDPNESQFLETTKANVATVCRYFGIPPEMIAAEAGNSLTYANTNEQSLHLLKYAVTPWLVRLDKALSSLLPRPQYVKLKPDSLLRATTQNRYATYAVAIKAGFMTIDEVRELENLPPLTNLPAPSKGNGHAPVLPSKTKVYPTG